MDRSLFGQKPLCVSVLAVILRRLVVLGLAVLRTAILGLVVLGLAVLRTAILALVLAVLIVLILRLVVLLILAHGFSPHFTPLVCLEKQRLFNR